MTGRTYADEKAKTNAQINAEKAISDWQVQYRRANNGKEPPMVQYERGWILVSCCHDHMMFPQRIRAAEMRRRAGQLKFRADMRDRKA